jgi:hypothetical protein
VRKNKIARVQFPKGGQKKFLDEVIAKLSAPSLRSLRQFGITTKYTTLKSYYQEYRTIPENLFRDLCALSNLDPKVKNLDEHWGQRKGGKTLAPSLRSFL